MHLYNASWLLRILTLHDVRYSNIMQRYTSCCNRTSHTGPFLVLDVFDSACPSQVEKSIFWNLVGTLLLTLHLNNHFPLRAYTLLSRNSYSHRSFCSIRRRAHLSTYQRKWIQWNYTYSVSFSPPYVELRRKSPAKFCHMFTQKRFISNIFLGTNWRMTLFVHMFIPIQRTATILAPFYLLLNMEL